MRILTQFIFFILVGLALPLSGCGGGGEIGGTETGTTESGLDTSQVASRLEAGGSALVPSVAASAVDASLSPGLVTRVAGSSTEWDLYLDPDNAYILTDIFGDPDEDPRVVTKIRILLEQFGDTVEGLFSRDPDITCLNATPLAEGDTLEISFYGDISNGASDNRYFDCLTDESAHGTDTGERDETILYGRDSSGVIRIATMSDDTSANAEETATRGDEKRIMAVVYSTYSEAVEEGATVIYLDLNFTHVSSYNGPDDTFDTDDDVVFKSRTRITGRITLDANGEIVDANGEFTGTKYDRGPTPQGIPFILVTRTVGRGSFGDGDFSLFKVDSDVDAVANIDRTFCIQAPADDSGLPAFSDPANCSASETAYAWAGSAFPFTISPELDQVFEEKPFYEDNDTDLIDDDGSNFAIPTYSTEESTE